MTNRKGPLTVVNVIGILTFSISTFLKTKTFLRNFPDMTTSTRSISRVDSTVERGIVNKVESDGVIYRDAEKCYVLGMVGVVHFSPECMV